MNKREIIVSAIVTATLILTGAFFIQGKHFDCYQPFFSNVSSCSLLGGSCISIQSQTGVIKLWEQFSTIFSDEETNFTCSPDCFGIFHNHATHAPDSVNGDSIDVP